MADATSVTPIGPGTVIVEVAGKREIVYVAGPAHDRWAFWNGHTFRSASPSDRTSREPSAAGASAHALTAPMPATVARILAGPGTRVRKGDPVIVLEAMKMELPIRALADATVAAVRCHEGELVQADQTLAELT
jgi:biotin carboxyl carrier protein